MYFSIKDPLVGIIHIYIYIDIDFIDYINFKN